MSTGFRLVVIAALLSSLSSASAFAQAPGIPDQVSVELVNVEVRARGANAQPLSDLPREAFRIYDEGEPVELTHFAWIPLVTPGSLADAASPRQARNIRLFL